MVPDAHQISSFRPANAEPLPLVAFDFEFTSLILAPIAQLVDEMPRRRHNEPCAWLTTSTMFISPCNIKELIGLSLEEPLSETERKKLHSILANPKALDEVIDERVEGWSSHRTWKKTKSS